MEILATLLAIALVYIVEQRIEINRCKESKKLWYDTALDFAKELEIQKEKNDQAWEDLLEENRF